MNPYRAKIARRYGVPEFWVEDCVAEMDAQPSRPWEAVAIDYARKYGARNRFGNERPHLVPIEDWDGLTTDFTAVSDAKMDLQRAWGKLSPGQQRALMRQALGFDDLRPADCSHRLAGRKRLRAA